MPPGIPASTGAFSQLLAPGLRKVYAEEIAGLEPEYDKIAQMEKSTRNYEDDLQVALLGTTPTKPQGNPTFFDSPIQGSTVRYTHVSYGLGFRVTREMWDDDLYGVMRKASKDLAQANAETIENQFWSVFNSATNAAAYAGFDGLALAHAAHTLLGGGTYGNIVNAQFSQTSVQLAIDNLEKMVNERGRKTRLKPWKLVVPVEMKWTAQEILGSPYKTSLIPNVAYPGNEINALKKEGLDFMIAHYLTSSTKWFLLARTHDVRFFWRRKPGFENSDEFSTGDALFKTFLRFSQGFSSWRGFVYGNG